MPDTCNSLPQLPLANTLVPLVNTLVPLKMFQYKFSNINIHLHTGDFDFLHKNVNNQNDINQRNIKSKAFCN